MGQRVCYCLATVVLQQLILLLLSLLRFVYCEHWDYWHTYPPLTRSPPVIAIAIATIWYQKHGYNLYTGAIDEEEEKEKREVLQKVGHSSVPPPRAWVKRAHKHCIAAFQLQLRLQLQRHTATCSFLFGCLLGARACHVAAAGGAAESNG